MPQQDPGARNPGTPGASAAQRARRSKGAETLEFTMVTVPLLASILVLFNAARGIYVKATLEYAVRVGVRTGITITGTQATAAHSNLTAMVNSTVQNNAFGLLRGDSGLAKIKVHNPFVNRSGALNTPPSGQMLYVAEAAANGFTMPPFAKGGLRYSYNVF